MAGLLEGADYPIRGQTQGGYLKITALLFSNQAELYLQQSNADKGCNAQNNLETPDHRDLKKVLGNVLSINYTKY